MSGRKRKWVEASSFFQTSFFFLENQTENSTEENLKISKANLLHSKNTLNRWSWTKTDESIGDSEEH